MTASEIQDIIVTIGSKIAVVIPLFLAAYFKLRNKISDDIETIKTHTDVALNRLNGMLSYVIHSFGNPAWLKVAVKRGDGEIEFRMLEISENYCKDFGFDRQSYLGKTDFEAGWDFETAKNFRKHDLEVWSSGDPITYIEKVNGKYLKFRKIRVQSADGISKGIFGYLVSDGEVEPENLQNEPNNF